MSSKYGTYLNNKRLSPNEWQPLKPGDELRLGGMDFLLQATASNRAVRETPKLKSVDEASDLVKSGPQPETKKAADRQSHASELAHVSLWTRVRAESINSTLATVLATILGAIFKTKSFPLSLLGSAAIFALVNYIPMIVTGQSLEKRVTGIKIVMSDGSPVTWATALFRELLMKSGSLILFMAASVVSAPVNSTAFQFLLVTAPVFHLENHSQWHPLLGPHLRH